MAFIFRSISNALDNFVLFADADPISAVTFLSLCLILAFSPLWASWIIQLQQYVLPQLQGQAEIPSSDWSLFNTDDDLYNAGHDLSGNPITRPTVTLSGGASPSATIPGSNVGLGVPIKWPEQSRVGSSPLRPSPLRNSESAKSQSDIDAAAVASVAESSSIRSSRSGSGVAVVGPTVRQKSDVCFYASSSPSQRGVVTFSPDGFGRRCCVYEVHPARQHDLYRTSPMSPMSLSRMSSPSIGSQTAVDIQLMDDIAKAQWVQIRAQESQVRADTKRLEAELRIDKQRIDAHYRAELQRIEEGIDNFSRDMGAINWNL